MSSPNIAISIEAGDWPPETALDGLARRAVGAAVEALARETPEELPSQEGERELSIVVKGRDLLTGLSLVLVVEGVLWALFPGRMRQAAAQAALSDPGRLRMGGLVFAVLGVALVWLVRH